ncbi:MULTISPECIES: LLM class flavin-dependent oxidoreductase [Metabacillus]|uniref:LLM class flavin-dependent oxidoreductase n=1 Tax=Metabacillus hrfriensis TaxID=3048891 RepID=A0ACD4R5V9_9BACI|nr:MULTISPECIES: LLM class flavin-dependent oxidoreductase [Metabacillus]UAL50367.1 LLM class flavin-dependent oxidoreductase [Metabacillus dongyingensis]USK26621.1 LLM class flavin-dependent oxidoreductase [Bacillus sp. CMF21]WHZ55842.1 LLM class flavin-dependent oxidoreductase [Metabacillus sp. CT-WN-B3]
MSNERINLKKEVKLSVLDLAPVVEGSTPSEAFKNTLDLAQHTEKWGYNRFWLAEHHNMEGIASSATAVLIGHVAGGTSKIRVGSGGIMLPNHAPLVIAEQFGTLESIYPGRIDLGLGRAPGTDQLTARALRRENMSNGEDFPEQLEELRDYFNPTEAKHVRAVPGQGLNIPIWLLGSSGFSAQLAGRLGLPFAFASHFSPEHTIPAMRLYRSSFKPSEVLQEPYAMVGANVVAADSDERAAYLATTMQQQFLNLVRNRPGKMQPPVENMEELWTAYEKAAIHQQLGSSIVGSASTVKGKLEKFLDETGADEIMVNASIYDHQERLRSFEIVSQLFK